MTALDMSGHIDDDFKSTDATRYSKTGGEYVNGRWVAGVETESPHDVNIQPATMKQLDHLSMGGERIIDARQVWINDGDIFSINESDEWTFVGVSGRFKCHTMDNRSQFTNSRNYCKCIVSRIDGGV